MRGRWLGGAEPARTCIGPALRHKPLGRGTVGMVQVHPNSRNVIPGQIKFSMALFAKRMDRPLFPSANPQL